MWEENKFPAYSVIFDLLGNTLIPQYTFKNFILKTSTRVTATEDFVACLSNGHQIIAASPNATLTTAG